MRERIKGKMTYVKMEGGFWGIIRNDGSRLQPTKVPQQFKQEDLEVECLIFYIDDGFSSFMWGEIVEIITFGIPV